MVMALIHVYTDVLPYCRELQTLFLMKVYMKDDTHKALLVTIWASIGYTLAGVIMLTANIKPYMSHETSLLP